MQPFAPNDWPARSTVFACDRIGTAVRGAALKSRWATKYPSTAEGVVAVKPRISKAGASCCIRPCETGGAEGPRVDITRGKGCYRVLMSFLQAFSTFLFMDGSLSPPRGLGRRCRATCDVGGVHPEVRAATYPDRVIGPLTALPLRPLTQSRRSFQTDRSVRDTGARPPSRRRRNSVDDRFERAVLQPLEHELDRGFPARLVATRKPDVVRLDGDHLGDHRQYRQRGDTSAQQAVDVYDTAKGQGRNQLREIGAADRIEGTRAPWPSVIRITSATRSASSVAMTCAAPASRSCCLFVEVRVSAMGYEQLIETHWADSLIGPGRGISNA